MSVLPALAEPAEPTPIAPPIDADLLSEHEAPAASNAATTVASSEAANLSSADLVGLPDDVLAEWIFTRHGSRLAFQKLYEEALRDNTLGSFKKVDLRMAHRRVYQTKNHRPPVTGWPLQSKYQKRAEKSRQQKS